jgi:hypothetical protein
MAEAKAPKEHKLNSSWSIWELRDVGSNNENYQDSLKKLGDCATIEEFWRYFNNIPKPSELFFNGQKRGFRDNRKVQGFCIFKTGIKPEWEDAKNRIGGEFFFRKGMDLVNLDLLYEHLTLGCIGETIDPENTITGIRVVDKSIFKKNQAIYRLELWFSTSDKNEMDTLKARMIEALQKANVNVPDFSYRAHQ